MIDIRTGKEMTRGGFLKGILASGIAPAITFGTASLAGSANATVGRGMMRNVGAKLGVNFSEKGGIKMFKIIIENESQNCLAFANEVIRLVKSHGVFNATVFTSLDTIDRNNMPCLIGIGSGSYSMQIVRYRGGVLSISRTQIAYDVDSRIGDEYWVIPVQGIPDRFNIG